MSFETDFHPDLRLGRFLPRSAVGARSLGPVRRLAALADLALSRGATVERVDPDVSVRLFVPRRSRHPVPGLLYIHGGGYVLGSAVLGDAFCRAAADRLGAVAASVEYRLAPEHPFPTPLEDCYAALCWLADQPDVDPLRLAVVGESAGGGLAAALAVLARDRGRVPLALQVLSYPMLDDRTTTRTDIDPRDMRLWSPDSNRFGWHSYLGFAADGDVPPYAAAARCENLSGLPPAWIGVGGNDLFHDENLAYAARLRQAGVPCTVHQVPGGYHGFDLVERWAPVSREFARARMTALANAFHGDTRPEQTGT